jgi:3D (Asp-Asp-Asp) domain-containing protein
MERMLELLDRGAPRRPSAGLPLFVSALALVLAGCASMEEGAGEEGEDLGSAEAEILANNSHYDGFTITNYVVAQESQLSGQHTGDSSFICPPGLNGNCYHKEFLCSGWGIPMQGTGLANDGSYIKYVSGGGPWSSGYVWWQNCGSATFAYVSGVTGASGRTLVANYSIAVDPGYIPLGSYVWIDAQNHWFRADDTGGAITGYHIDVYTGTSQPGYNFVTGMYLTQTVHGANDPSPYGAGPIVVDDTSAGFTKYGQAAYWWQDSIGQGAHMWWTYVNGSVLGNYARWKPTLSSSGSYAVYTFIPWNNATAQQATYRIYHQGVNNYSTVNQNAYSDVWVYLGTYTFSANGTEYVELGDNTGEATSTYRKVGFDAVKFVKQ